MMRRCLLSTGNRVVKQVASQPAKLRETNVISSSCLSAIWKSCVHSSAILAVEKQAGDTQPVSRYPVCNVKELPVHVQERMYKLHDKVGFIPNLFHALAHRPDEFKCYLDHYDVITGRKNSNLTRGDRELAGIAASSVTGCVYCVITHCALHRLSTNDPHLSDQVAVNPQTPSLSPRQRAVVDFALSVTRNEILTDDDFARLAEHGLDREDAWDIASFTSLTAFINRMATFMDVKPNLEFYAMGRTSEKR